MSIYIEEFINQLESELPEMCTTDDLVENRLFTSPVTAYIARENGKGPEFVALSRKNIIYPKKAVINWVRERAKLSQAKKEPKP